MSSLHWANTPAHCRTCTRTGETLSTLAIATAREVFDLLRDDLVAIEQELGRDAASGVSTITEIAEYLREGGGKRIRPIAAAARRAHAGLLRPGRHPPGRGGGDGAHRHAGPRRHHRRRRHAPRPALGQHHLGQRKMRAGRRLALHAGLPAWRSKRRTCASSTCSSA